MKSFSGIFGNLSKSVGASGFQFIIILFSTPIMTRIYAPEAYAAFGILNSAAALLVGIGMFSLPIAYTIEKDSSARIALVRMMLWLLGGLVLLAVLLSIGVAVAENFDIGIHVSVFALIIFPLLVLTCGIRQIVVNIAISKAHFNSTALGQIIEPIWTRGTGIVLGGILGGNPVFMLLSVALGQIATIITICRLVLKDIFWKWRSYFVATLHPMTTLRRYTDFIWFNTASQQIHPVLLLGIQISITGVFSAEFAGHYILAVSILSLPASMIALATAPVVYRHFLDVEKHKPQQLVRQLLTAMGCYLLIGFCTLAPIFVFGQEIFRLAFGAAWEHAGMIASTLSVSYFTMFAVVGVQSIFTVTRRLKLQFILEIGLSIFALVAIIICFKTMTFDTAIYYLCIIWLLKNIFILAGCIFVAFKHNNNVTIA